MEETHIGSGLELRVVPSTLSLILGGDIPGLVAVTPASAAAAKFAYAMTGPGEGGSLPEERLGPVVSSDSWRLRR